MIAPPMRLAPETTPAGTASATPTARPASTRSTLTRTDGHSTPSSRRATNAAATSPGEGSARVSGAERVHSAHNANNASVDAHAAPMLAVRRTQRGAAHDAGVADDAADEDDADVDDSALDVTAPICSGTDMTFPSIALPISGSTSVISAQPIRFPARRVIPRRGGPAHV